MATRVEELWLILDISISNLVGSAGQTVGDYIVV